MLFKVWSPIKVASVSRYTKVNEDQIEKNLLAWLVSVVTYPQQRPHQGGIGSRLVKKKLISQHILNMIKLKLIIS